MDTRLGIREFVIQALKAYGPCFGCYELMSQKSFSGLYSC